MNESRTYIGPFGDPFFFKFLIVDVADFTIAGDSLFD